MRKLKRLLLIGLIVFSMTGAAACGPEVSDKGNQEKAEGVTVSGQLEVSDIPEYSGEPYIEINGNEPDFDQDQITDKSFEEYSQLDSLGRCQEAEASIGDDLIHHQGQCSCRPHSNSTPGVSGWPPVSFEMCIRDSLVCSSASERATDTLDKKIKKLIRKDMEQMCIRDSCRASHLRR